MNAIGGLGNVCGTVGNPWAELGKFLIQVGKYELAAKVLRPPQKIIVPEKAGNQLQAGSHWSDGHLDLQA